MKLIILAAGEGSRLRPLTNNRPKCMVKYKNKAIIDYILDAVSECNIEEIAVVGGYKFDILKEHLKDQKISFYENKSYAKSNMLSSLFCAKEFMDDDIIISYSDIIYDKSILQALINSTDDFSVVADKDWLRLWSIRMENPLQDAESFLVKNSKIIELGKKVYDINEIQAQYIGLIKISKNVIAKIKSFYNELDKNLIYDSKNFENMYMTSFIQLVIDNLMDVTPVYIDGKWLEIDTIDDLKKYEGHNLLNI